MLSQICKELIWKSFPVAKPLQDQFASCAQRSGVPAVFTAPFDQLVRQIIELFCIDIIREISDMASHDLKNLRLMAGKCSGSVVCSEAIISM
jgi:hypothetical protein